MWQGKGLLDHRREQADEEELPRFAPTSPQTFGASCNGLTENGPNMARPGNSGGSIAPPRDLSAVHQPSRFRGWLAVGAREPYGGREMKPVRRYLGPGLELAKRYAGLDWSSGAGTIDGHDLAYYELGLKRGLEVELRHDLNERVDARLH